MPGWLVSPGNESLVLIGTAIAASLLIVAAVCFLLAHMFERKARRMGVERGGR